MISIIIPMYNASKYLHPCLQTIQDQKAEDMEVILVDDNSTDNTVKTAGQFPFKIVELKERKGQAHARNKGAKAAKGDILLFVDADVQLAAEAVKMIDLKDADAVSGIYTEETPEQDFFSQLQNFLLIYRYKNLSDVEFTNSALCAIRRKAFEDVGGYNEDIVPYEDIELGHRLTEKGFRCRMDPAFKGTHLRRFTHREIFKGHFRKVILVGGYKRRRFIKNFFHSQKDPGTAKRAKIAKRHSELPLSFRIAGAASGLAALFIWSKLFFFFLVLYSVAMFPLLQYLVQRRGAGFGIKAYFVCFEIYVVTFSGLLYGSIKNV